MNFKTGRGCGVDPSGSQQGTVVWSREYGNDIHVP